MKEVEIQDVVRQEVRSLIRQAQQAPEAEKAAIEGKLMELIRTLEPGAQEAALGELSGAGESAPAGATGISGLGLKSDEWTLVERKHDQFPTWRGQLENPEPAYMARPRSVEDIVKLVRSTPLGESIDILGAGISTNGVFARSGSRLMLTEEIGRKLAFEPGLYVADPETRHWYRTEAGVRANVMFDEMWDAKLSLDWGGATPQAVMGAASTSSHKSGFLGPLQDLILSFEIVTPDGAIVRVEPKAGITRRDAFEAMYKDRTLIQDDELFYSSVILCNSGIVYSVILQAEPRFWLELTRTYYENWDNAKADVHKLLKDQENGAGPWQFELWATPRKKRMMVVSHVKKTGPGPRAGNPGGDVWSVAWTAIKDAGEKTLVAAGYDVLSRTMPDVFEMVLEDQLHGRATPPNAPIYLEGRHYGGGGVPDLLMSASENVVEYHGPDTPFDWLEQIRNATTMDKGYCFSSPISLRFVGPSKHALSMFKDGDRKRFMVVETITIPNAANGQDILRAVDNVFRNQARPHWGLNNFLREQAGRVEGMYGPDLRTWRATRNKLVGERPTLFKMPPPLNRELSFSGRFRVSVKAKVLKGAPSVSAWYFMHAHQTDVVQVRNELPIPVEFRERLNDGEHRQVPAESQSDWRPSRLDWIKDESEWPRQAMHVMVEGRCCARVFLRMMHGQKVDRRVHIETGGGLYNSRPLADLPVDQIQLVVSGEFQEPLQTVFDTTRMKVVVFVRGEDRHLHLYYPENGVWNCDSATFKVASAISGSVGAIFNDSRRHGEVIVRSADGRMNYFWLDRSGLGWQHDDQSFGPTSATGSIAAVFGAERGQPECFCVDPDGVVTYYFHDHGAFQFERSPFQHLRTNGSLSAIYNTKQQRAELYMCTSDGEICHFYREADRWSFEVVSRPMDKQKSDGLMSAVYNAKAGVSELFFTDERGYLHRYTPAQESQVEELTPSMRAGGGVMTSACGPSDEFGSVFFRAENGLLHHAYHNGVHWVEDGKSFVGAGRVESASAVWSPTSEHAEVVVRGEDGKISHFHKVHGSWKRDTISYLSA